jgi:hypothetical protein
MRQSKTGTLLSTFTKREWADFSDFMESPFFNKNQDLFRLTVWLKDLAPEFEGVERGDVWEILFPGTPPDERQINYLFSWLFQYAGQFLAMSRYRDNHLETEMDIARHFSARGLSKFFTFQVARTRRMLDDLPLRNDRYHHLEFQLIDLERAHLSSQSERKSNPFLQSGADALDRFYFSQKLRYACAMLNEQGIVAASFELTFTDEIRAFLAVHPPWLTIPSIAVFYRIWRMLSQTDSDNDFLALKALIAEHASVFSADEQKELYGYALNYCIRQIRNVREEYVAEALHLYERSIENGVLLSGGELLPWHFKNIVRLGLRSKRFDWTEVFIREKSNLLNSFFRSDALHFSLADLYFYTKRYDNALTHLNQVAFSDVHYMLGAKEMLAKIYFEHNEHNALDSHIHAFRVFLRRNKQITNEIRHAYLHFLAFLEQAVRAKPGTLQQLRERVSNTEPLVAKAWLLEQLG